MSELWYRNSSAWADSDDLADLAHVGPAPEDDWEDGLEAPLRPSVRWCGLRDDPRDEATLPDVEALWQVELERHPDFMRQHVREQWQAQLAEQRRIERLKRDAANRRHVEKLRVLREARGA